MNLKKLCELEAKATKAPWEPYSSVCCVDRGWLSVQGGEKITESMDIVDAELAAESRNALPALLKVAEAALRLRNSGYDGPFLGEVCEPLFSALRELGE